MIDIRLIDSNFAHATSCSNGDLKIYPRHFNWYRGSDPKEVTVFVDNACQQVHQVTANKRVWMLLEPPTISPHLYQLARSPIVQGLFDYILTFDKELVKIDPKKFVYYPLGGCWIEQQDRKIYPKTKNVSIIASEKSFTEGHKLRHDIIHRYSGRIDVYGRGYKFIPSKLEALKDYRYTIVIENCQLDNYFSEKLIDPMVCGTIPIYWGTPNHEKDKTGIQILNLKDLDGILTSDMEAYYEAHLSTVESNFKAAQQYVNTEDWLWEHFFSKICTTTVRT